MENSPSGVFLAPLEGFSGSPRGHRVVGRCRYRLDEDDDDDEQEKEEKYLELELDDYFKQPSLFS